MKKIFFFILTFLGLFFLSSQLAYAGANFAGVKIIIEDHKDNKLNNVRVDLESHSNETYTGSKLTRRCHSDSTANYAGPFINLNYSPDQYYRAIRGLKTGEKYTYEYTYDNPAGTLYFGNGVNSTLKGGGMGFGFGCACNPLKIIIHVPEGYYYDKDGDNKVDSGETGQVTISKDGLQNDRLYTYSFTLEQVYPVPYQVSPANNTTFVAGTSSVTLKGKATDADLSKVMIRFRYKKIKGRDWTTFKACPSQTNPWGWAPNPLSCDPETQTCFQCNNRNYRHNWKPGGTEISVTLDDLSSGTYEWQVQAVDKQYNYSGWTTSRRFTINSKPTAYHVSPADKASFAEGSPVTLTGRGTDPDGDQVKIRVQYRKVDNNIENTWTIPHYDAPLNNEHLSYGWHAWDSSGGTASDTLSGLAAGTYEWQVQAIDEHGLLGDWTPSRTFTITAPTSPTHIRYECNLETWDCEQFPTTDPNEGYDNPDACRNACTPPPVEIKPFWYYFWREITP